MKTQPYEPYSTRASRTGTGGPLTTPSGWSKTPTTRKTPNCWRKVNWRQPAFASENPFLTDMLISFAQRVNDLPADQEIDRILAEARKVLDGLDPEATCHQAVEAFVRVTGTGTAIRGYYAPHFGHSWVEFPRFILDIYPVGGARPILVSRRVAYNHSHTPNGVYRTFVTRFINPA